MCSFAAVLFSIISLYSSRPTDYSSCLPHALLLFEKLSACLTKSRYCFFRLACDIGERLGRKLEDTLSTRVQTKSPQPMEMKQLNISATLPFLGFQTFLISSQASNEGSLAPSPPLWCFCELVGHHLFDSSTDYPNSCWIIVLLPSTACGGIRPTETTDGGHLRLPTEEQYLIYNSPYR
jgi:hypothetical protein